MLTKKTHTHTPHFLRKKVDILEMAFRLVFHKIFADKKCTKKNRRQKIGHNKCFFFHLICFCFSFCSFKLSATDQSKESEYKSELFIRNYFRFVLHRLFLPHVDFVPLNVFTLKAIIIVIIIISEHSNSLKSTKKSRVERNSMHWLIRNIFGRFIISLMLFKLKKKQQKKKIKWNHEKKKIQFDEY